MPCAACDVQCEYMGAVFSEALRLYPPAHVTSRQSKEDLTLGGHHLPAGIEIVWGQASGANVKWVAGPGAFPDVGIGCCWSNMGLCQVQCHGVSNAVMSLMAARMPPLSVCL